MKVYLLFYVEMQVSFLWTDQMEEAVESKKKGDIAFRQKDLKEAVEFYTQVCLSFVGTCICP